MSCDRESPKLLIKRCSLKNNKICNEFITSVQKMAGVQASEYNGDDNLCLKFRELYTSEENDNKVAEKSHAKTGGARKKRTRICSSKKAADKKKNKELYYEVPIDLKHKKTEIEQHVIDWVRKQAELYMVIFDGAEIIVEKSSEDLSSGEETAGSPLLKSNKLDLRSRREKWERAWRIRKRKSGELNHSEENFVHSREKAKERAQDEGVLDHSEEDFVQSRERVLV